MWLGVVSVWVHWAGALEATAIGRGMTSQSWDSLLVAAGLWQGRTGLTGRARRWLWVTSGQKRLVCCDGGEQAFSGIAM